MLDRAARSTVRNFSTLFLICLVVFLPLEIAYATIHQSAIEVRELAPFIEELPGNQRVKGVGPAELDDARRDRMILTAVELALVPLMVSAARRVFQRDAAGDLPTATDAYLHSMTPLQLGPLPPADSIGAVGVAVVFSLSVGFATYQAGLLLADVLPDRFDFVLLGAVEACARSLALPWFLGAWVEAGRVKERRRPTTDSPFARPP